jgi:hypothetical protein
LRYDEVAAQTGWIVRFGVGDAHALARDAAMARVCAGCQFGSRVENGAVVTCPHLFEQGRRQLPRELWSE